jgi:hypothetical protein
VSSFPDQLTGYGTVALAIVTVAGVITSLITTRQDRGRADRQAAADRDAAADLAESDRRLARQAEERRHRTTLLLDLGHQIAISQAMASMPQAGLAKQEIRLLLHALPTECAYTVRQFFNVAVPELMDVPGYVGTKLQELKIGQLNPTTVSADQMFEEIRYDLDHYEDGVLGWRAANPGRTGGLEGE